MRRVFNIVFIFLVSVSVGRADEKLSQMAKEMVERHNELRAKHGSPPVTWNSKIAEVAQAWAEVNAASNKMFHSKGKYGENIFWTSRGMPSGARVVDSWYSEIKDYDYDNPGFALETGHFTQVVWKDSREIGAGWARSQDGGLFVVCNYDPPGNYQGRFPKNVAPLDESPDTSPDAGDESEEKDGQSKSHSSAFAKFTGSTKNMPAKVSARTMSASNQKLLDAALLKALQQLSDDNALSPVPLSLSITARKVVLVKVEPESKLMLQAAGAGQKVPVNFDDLKLSDRATLSLLVASLRKTSKDAQAMAGVYMELVGKMQDASKFYSKAGAESSGKLAGLFD